MLICCIGDSLTEGDYGVFGKRGIANVHEKNYPYFLSKALEAEGRPAEVRNFGKCGYRSGHYLNWYREGNADVSGADLILVMLGANGGQSSTQDTPDNAAYAELIAALHADAPQAKILLCTTPHVTENPFYSNCGYAPQVREAVLFVRRFAETSGYPLIDTAAFPEFCAETEALYQSGDGLHFNEAGYKMLAAKILEAIRPYL